MEEITARSIRETITGWIKEKKQISPEVWLNAAQKLNMLATYEDDNLMDLEKQYNDLINSYAEAQKVEKPNMTAAERKAKSSDIYVAFRKQEALIKRIDKDIALASKNASLTSYAH